MIAGLGVDIVEIERMAAALKRHPRMKERCFSEAEREYCESKTKPEVHYAMRFAAKEAVLKALGTGFSGMRFTDVEVQRDERGRPVPVLGGRAADVAKRLRVSEIHLSLSFSRASAVASAVAIGVSDEPEREEVQLEGDDILDVASAFKEVRAMLDEVDQVPAEE